MRANNSKLIVAALLALMTTACSTADEDKPSDGSEAGVPVIFEATQAGEADTRALIAGKTGLQSTGFGVFAYHHDGTAAAYNSATSVPNFMHNQNVVWGSAAWVYSPLCYWPNESDNDHLSFLAYAPYSNAENATEGITGRSAVKAAGDAWVSYRSVSDPTKSVDLMWASPLLNLSKQATAVKLTFHHALAALTYAIKPRYTYNVYKINKVEIISGSKGLCVGGKLNLNNKGATPVWTELDIIKNQTVFSKDWGGATLAEETKADGEWMIVPTGDDQDYMVKISYTRNDEVAEITSKVITVKFEAGQPYHLNIEIQ